MKRCPNCRGRDRGEPRCHRCGMDLSRLRHLEAQATAWEALAVKRLAAGDRQGARQATATALSYQGRPLAQALVRFLSADAAT